MVLRRLLPALAALAALLLLVACGGDESGPAAPSPGSANGAGGLAPVFSCKQPPAATVAEAAAFPVTVPDGAGGRLTLQQPPSAIASLSAGHTEMLYAIGAGGQLIAVDKTSDCPDAVAPLPHVDAFSPSVEAIAALEPDLVVLFYDPGGFMDALGQQGIPAVLFDTPSSIEAVYEQIEALGKVTGHTGDAGRLVARMSAEVRSIQEGLGGVTQGPRVFHEIDNTYYTAGPGSFVDDLYTTLRATNIARESGQPFPKLSAEAIIAADPEVIVLADEDAGESPRTVAERPGWSVISAVNSGRIYAVDPDVVSRPGPRLVDALIVLARFLYPETFR